ncbi:MAG: hypothetical protein ACOC56_02120 [Atribacterota bacterium]
MNNKGFVAGFGWIIGFFLFLLIFFFFIGLIDVAKVEIFSPMSDRVHNMTLNQTGDNSSVYVQKQQEIHDTTDSITLPYNLILILMTILFIAYSTFDVVRQEKMGFITLLYSTIGGVAFVIYVIHLFIFGVLDYFQLQVIGQLFGDLIDNQAPFYNTLIDNWWWVFIWALFLQFMNNKFGKEDEEQNRGVLQ